MTDEEKLIDVMARGILTRARFAGMTINEAAAYAHAALAAAREAGYVIVPVNPTEAMYAAAEREWDGRMSARSAGVWRAMIAAA